MVTSVRWRWFLFPILGIALLAGALVVQVDGAKPPPPPPPTPPVQYNIIWLDKLGYPSSTAYDVNSAGDVVGSLEFITGATSSHAFLYKAGGTVSDINVLAAGLIPAGWTACQGRGINNQGQIVGQATYTDGHTCGFLFDPTLPQFVLLPEMDQARFINNNADIVGYVAADSATVLDTWDAGNATYQTQRWPGMGVPDGMNDSRQIVVGGAGLLVQRYNPTTNVWDNFSSYGMTWGGGINNAGTFVGRRTVYDAHGRSTDAAFRFTDGQSPTNILIQSLALGYDVNLSGDVVLWDGNRSRLYTDQIGLWNLDNLVVDDTGQWIGANRIDAWKMTDRDLITGFPLICGRAVQYDKVTRTTHVSAFLLIPIPK